MQKIFNLLCILVFLSLNVFSQSASITGKVLDKSEKKPVNNVVVALLTPIDSFIYKFCRTDINGNFSLKNIKYGNYILITEHSQFGDYTDSVLVTTPEIDFGKIELYSKSKLLEAVIVKSGSAIRIKGDTTIYTADSFKVSANANVEELLKKMPGIQVNKNGEIKAMGEKVSKVLVDGEEFFGDDPGMAVKNIRADAVKEVQVFDKKSDQAEFTGIDDGATKKTINLKLKDNKKKGYFGKIDGAAGPQKNIDDRYNTNILLSSFKGKRKLAAFLLNGNTGQDGLSWQDSEKFGGGNENYSISMDDNGEVNYQWTGNNNDDEPYVNTENGFIRNTNVGLQYNNKWNDKQSVNVSPKYNSQIYNNKSSNFLQTQYGDSVLNEIGNKITNVNNSNFKINASSDIKIDSSNSVKFTTGISVYENYSTEVENTTTTGSSKLILKNTSDKTLNVKNNKESYFGSVLFKHKFKKSRRTFSLNSSLNFLNSDGDNLLKSNNVAFANGSLSSVQKINQNKISDKASSNVVSNITYTEPLNKKMSLEVSHLISINNGLNNQITYGFNNTNGKFDIIVDSLSNNFSQKIIVNKPSFRINYNSKKIKYSIGSGVGFTNFDFNDNSFNKNYKRTYTNFFPNASFTYSYKSNHNLRLFYNGNTTQPTLNDLQPLRNNVDYFNQFIGNPNLKQSFTNSIRISHNTYNFLKEMSSYQTVNISTSRNAISYSRLTDLDSGKTIIKPININGNLSIYFYGGTWFKIKKIALDVGINPNFNFNRKNNVINNVSNFSKTLSTGMSLYLSKEKEKKYYISLEGNINNNRNSSTQSKLIRKFNTYSFGFDATYYYKKTWSINTNFNNTIRQKTVDFQNNLSYKIWNVKLQKTFKKDEFTAYIIVRDILGQNIGISRNFSENSLSEETNDRLKRYAMIGFVWNFKNKNKATKIP